MLRVRDSIDRASGDSLDISALARMAFMSEAHFIRTFKDTFGETPHRYLQRRRIERAMTMLRSTDRSVTDICIDVGFSSVATFSRTFRQIVGQSPTSFRRRGPLPDVPTCFTKTWTRVSSFGTAAPKPPP
jgi:AraC-like DNA-binding protein